MAIDPTMLMQIMPMLSGGGSGGGAGSMPGMGQFQSMAGSGMDMIRMISAMRALKELNKIERPNYSISPELAKSYSRAENRAGMGFTPTQTQQFNQNLSSTLGADFANSRNMSGGSLAQALMSRYMGQQLRALNQFAANDAMQQGRNIAYADQMGGRVQQQRNLQTGQDINYRMNDERALGQAVQDTYMNMRNSLSKDQAMNAGGGTDYSGMQGFGSNGLQGMFNASQKGMNTPGWNDPSA